MLNVHKLRDREWIDFVFVYYRFVIMAVSECVESERSCMHQRSCMHYDVRNSALARFVCESLS